MNNANTAGHDHLTPNRMAQVFLAYAIADDCCPPGAAIANAGEVRAVEALRQLFTQAQISYWQCPWPWPADADAEVTISRATEACDNYVLALSPRALADVFCLQGLLFALSLNKRVVPVLIETVPVHRLPEPLQTLEVIDLRARSAPLAQTTGARQLLHTLHLAADYYHDHTQLLLRALEWERQRRNPALLLQGDELTQYQHWLVQANGQFAKRSGTDSERVSVSESHHRPIQLQTLYVAESARQGSAVSQGWLKRWF
ncbi:toll/interleukin-1 receptor domain-containing protein [Leptolyngbya sp. CCNP1308]|uniref:toll/interleukin-1 receptor domain-containing protein n=1 Tax=Leptolyngbya sp. CCNP1308 TaxID=3110255 RepID=UPI002B213844|nr:toll/interleukin-1 receptor domain-containing protein [Leptolyngbya sp. CCNP1308]MEA5450151.1 toll/interleukin-1 receptor domain-containing protein [Leptolyngbya sp. CCNP1308]